MSWIALVLACTSQPERDPAQARWDALQAERADLHAAERVLLSAEAERAVAAGDLSQAALAVASAERLGGVRDLTEAVVEAVAEEPVLAAQLHLALAEVLSASDPTRARQYRARGEQLQAEAAIQARYAPEAWARTQAEWQGVRREMLPALVQRLLSEHVAPPAPEVIRSAVDAHFARLRNDPVATSTVPALSRLPTPEAGPGGAEAAQVVAASLQATERAVAAGVPESVAVAEWMQGALLAFDPFTRVAWPAELETWQAHHIGVEQGVGLQLMDAPDGQVQVEWPSPGGPAFRAGVKQGDRVLAIREEGEVQHVDSLDPSGRALAALAALRGAPGTRVSLDLQRGDVALRVELERASVPQETVTGWSRRADNAVDPWLDRDQRLAYLRIDRFRPHTDERVHELLSALEPEPGALVLDLRGNPGGDVQAAVNVLDLFLSEGEAARLEGPGAPPPPADDELAWNVLTPGDAWEDLSIAVLVDRDSASASELVAGALQWHGRAVVVGEHTVGKGWTQGLRVDETHGFALEITNAAWVLASGQQLQRAVDGSGGGLVPDVRLDFSVAEAWQVEQARSQAEFPRSHHDGSPMVPPAIGHRAGLPVLGGDPGVVRAVWALRQREG